MEGLNDDAQWIVLMGFVVSFSFFFLAMIINQSTVVGQTTAEAVIEFPKNDIRDERYVIIKSAGLENPDPVDVHKDIVLLSLSRKGAVVSYSVITPTAADPRTHIDIHYNNGVTAYNESWTSS